MSEYQYCEFQAIDRPLTAQEMGELATVMRALLEKHPELRLQAESIAVEMISSSSVDNIAEDVLDVVSSRGVDSFQQRDRHAKYDTVCLHNM